MQRLLSDESSLSFVVDPLEIPHLEGEDGEETYKYLPLSATEGMTPSLSLSLSLTLSLSLHGKIKYAFVK